MSEDNNAKARKIIADNIYVTIATACLYTLRVNQLDTLLFSDNHKIMVTIRNVVFVNNQIYHVFNRGVARQPTFTNKWEYQRMLDAISFYRYSRLPLRLSKYLQLAQQERYLFQQQLLKNHFLEVEIISFCLMPNHFHLVLKQVSVNGISRFVANITNSYTKFLNTRHQRVGPLFQGTFKAVLVETEEQLLHLTRYVHINPVTSFLIPVEKLATYPWSSLQQYLSEVKYGFCDLSLIYSLISPEEYKSFVFDQISYAKELEKIKHLTFE